MNLLDPDDEIPRSSILFLLITFFVLGFIIQSLSIIFGAYEAFYSPLIDLILGRFPRDGESTTISVVTIWIVGSVLFSVFGLFSVLITRRLRRL